jgi:hypothetical protein
VADLTLPVGPDGVFGHTFAAALRFSGALRDHGNRNRPGRSNINHHSDRHGAVMR